MKETRGTQKDGDWMVLAARAGTQITIFVTALSSDTLKYSPFPGTKAPSTGPPLSLWGVLVYPIFKGEETEAQAPDCLLLEGSGVPGGP